MSRFHQILRLTSLTGVAWWASADTAVYLLNIPIRDAAYVVALVGGILVGLMLIFRASYSASDDLMED